MDIFGRFANYLSRLLPKTVSANVRSKDYMNPAQSESLVTIFEVSDVEKATDSLLEVSYYVAVESLITSTPIPPSYFQQIGQHQTFPTKARKLEACSSSRDRLLAGIDFHPVIAAIQLAFNDHRPLYLSPDIIWLLISQGFATHVNKNSDKLRSCFVKHQGKLEISIERHDFIKGSLDNPWNEVFNEFSEAIRQHIGTEIYNLLLPNFSTTGIVERAVTEIVLLNTMQSYFSYSVFSLCGIPQIKLGGTVGDWQQLVDRTKQLARFELDWWIQPLIPILEQFIAAAKGEVDRDFWQSLYKYHSMSGGGYITGWIALFFPDEIETYLKRQTYSNTNSKYAQRRKELEEKLVRKYGNRHDLLVVQSIIRSASNHDIQSNNTYLKDCEITIDRLPSGLAKAPFQWQYLENIYPMQFIGGFVGVRQDQTDLCLRPEIGWAIREVENRT
jgi:hypothetical protein